MSYVVPGLKRGSVGVSGFADDAQAAITNNPAYFVTWYTLKSWLLVASLAYIAYLHGRDSR